MPALDPVTYTFPFDNGDRRGIIIWERLPSVIVAGDPGLISVRVILDRGVIPEGGQAIARSRHIHTTGIVERDGARLIDEIAGTVVAGDPELIPVQTVFDRRVVQAGANTGTGSCHIHTTRADCDGDSGITVVPWAVVTRNPERMTVR